MFSEGNNKTKHLESVAGYTILGHLGKGTFGDVFEVEKLNHVFAMKRMKREVRKHEGEESGPTDQDVGIPPDQLMETSMQSTLRHKNLMPAFEIFFAKTSTNSPSQTTSQCSQKHPSSRQEHLHLIMPMAPWTLGKYLKKVWHFNRHDAQGHMSPSESPSNRLSSYFGSWGKSGRDAKRWTLGSSDCVQLLSLVKDVFAGLESLHHSGISHNDVKPDNFLLMEKVPHQQQKDKRAQEQQQKMTKAKSSRERKSGSRSKSDPDKKHHAKKEKGSSTTTGASPPLVWRARLSDFGTVTLVDAEWNRMHRVGTIMYHAPEVRMQWTPGSEKEKRSTCGAADLWCAGLVFLNVCFGIRASELIPELREKEDGADSSKDDEEDDGEEQGRRRSDGDDSTTGINEAKRLKQKQKKLKWKSHLVDSRVAHRWFAWRGFPSSTWIRKYGNVYRKGLLSTLAKKGTPDGKSCDKGECKSNLKTLAQVLARFRPNTHERMMQMWGKVFGQLESIYTLCFNFDPTQRGPASSLVAVAHDALHLLTAVTSSATLPARLCMQPTHSSSAETSVADGERNNRVAEWIQFSEGAARPGDSVHHSSSSANAKQMWLWMISVPTEISSCKVAMKYANEIICRLDAALGQHSSQTVSSQTAQTTTSQSSQTTMQRPMFQWAACLLACKLLRRSTSWVCETFSSKEEIEQLRRYERRICTTLNFNFVGPLAKRSEKSTSPSTSSLATKSISLATQSSSRPLTLPEAQIISTIRN